MNKLCHTRMNESCQSCDIGRLQNSSTFFATVRGGVMSRRCRTYEWVTSHVWMGRVTHVWMSRFNHLTWVDFKTVALFVPLFVDESCHVYATHMNESCQSHDMGELQDSSTFWNVREWDSSMWRDSFLCAAYVWHIPTHTRNVTKSDTESFENSGTFGNVRG